MKNLYLLIVLLSAFSFMLAGCLNFGKDEETTSPTKAHVSRCQSEMYLNPSMKIIPLGFKIEDSGMDAAIWFKFKTDTSDLHKIFVGKVVDTSKFKNDFTFIHEMDELKWWDAKDKKLVGGQVRLPNVRFMNVGIEKNGEGYIVYIMWHEV
ncbi:hypothetical protein MNBD_PLANCTO02-1757 [hydrothermal vent metagenome]|uniref:Lipoprotein n=1 Tax=hydrothermal vent metagenome TaxID=652676 RepID=A0A3B1E6I3_9ZZZZ